MSDAALAWLRAQLDADERVALAAQAENTPPWRYEGDADSMLSKIRTADGFTVVHVEDSTPEPDTAEHIANWDPARVLAEIEAKRQRLDLIAGELADDPTDETAQWLAKVEAQPYADRPGFPQEWR